MANFANNHLANQSDEKPSLIAKVGARFVRHLQQAIGSLGDLWRTPFTSVMTILVLGISLTLPATLHLFVKNAKSISEQWDSASEISLFLKLSVKTWLRINIYNWNLRSHIVQILLIFRLFLSDNSTIWIRDHTLKLWNIVFFIPRWRLSPSCL